jgi:hypothetical protein
VSIPPTTLPIAPTPMMPMEVPQRSLAGVDYFVLKAGITCEALELLEDHRLRRADRLAHVDDLEAGVLVLDLHELLGDELGRPDQP